MSAFGGKADIGCYSAIGGLNQRNEPCRHRAFRGASIVQFPHANSAAAYRLHTAQPDYVVYFSVSP